jgi:uncharacterized DUF497 family protein
MAVQMPPDQRVDWRVTGFDWDQGNREKCQKHGVPLAAVERLFAGPLAISPDPAHSAAEERFKAIGRADDERHVLIVFTMRRRSGTAFIRPISARYMHGKEIEHYEKAIAEAEQRQGG